MESRERTGIAMIGPFPPPPMGPAVRNGLFADEFERNSVPVDRVDTTKGRVSLIKRLVRGIHRRGTIYLSASNNGQIAILPIALLVALACGGRRLMLYPAGGQLYESVMRLPALARRLYLWLLRRVSYVFVETNGMKAKLGRIYDPSRIIVLPNAKPYRAKQIREYPSDTPMNERRLLYLSRVRPEKGIEVLVEAMDVVRSRGCDASLEIYGLLTDEYRDRFAKLLDVRPFIRYNGVLSPNEELLHAIASYYAMVFPSLWKNEGFPGVLADVALAGLPVIASDVAYNSEIITHEVEGLIVKEGDVGELATAIEHLLRDADKRNTLARNNFEKSRTYRIDNAVQVVLDVMHRDGNNA